MLNLRVRISHADLGLGNETLSYRADAALGHSMTCNAHVLCIAPVMDR